jgi:hypothetical protein
MRIHMLRSSKVRVTAPNGLRREFKNSKEKGNDREQFYYDSPFRK